MYIVERYNLRIKQTKVVSSSPDNENVKTGNNF